MSSAANAVGFSFVERLAQDLRDERLELPAFPQAVNRIQRVRFLGVRVPTPLVPYNFRERHRHSFSVFVGAPPQRVRIRFHRAVRQYITETRWHASQQIDDLPDGHCMFQVEVSEPHEVCWWALPWGANAEVLEPESLRQEMAETARALVGVYES